MKDIFFRFLRSCQLSRLLSFALQTSIFSIPFSICLHSTTSKLKFRKQNVSKAADNIYNHRCWLVVVVEVGIRYCYYKLVGSLLHFFLFLPVILLHVFDFTLMCLCCAVGWTKTKNLEWIIGKPERINKRLIFITWNHESYYTLLLPALFLQKHKCLSNQYNIMRIDMRFLFGPFVLLWIASSLSLHVCCLLLTFREIFVGFFSSLVLFIVISNKLW